MFFEVDNNPKGIWSKWESNFMVSLKLEAKITYTRLDTAQVHMYFGVTRKHWPPVHGPPLRTGSVDYQRTGPRTTPTDPSTDHPPNKIKNKNKDFTYCLSNRSLVPAKFCVLRWSTLGKCDRPGFSLERKLCHCRSLHLCHFRCCSFAWKTGKPTKFVISFPSPFCVYVWNLWRLGRVHEPAGE